jgi:hypothetical protein
MTKSPILGYLFSSEKIARQFWPKKGLGYILGDFFTKLIWSHFLIYGFQSRFYGQSFSRMT